MRIETILCPVDFTPLSMNHLRLAVSVCRQFGARLVVEHNVGCSPPYFMGVSWMWSEGHEVPDQAEAEDAGRKMETLLGELPGELQPTGKLSRGPLDTSLLAAAEEVGAGLIVIGSQGWGGVDHRSVTEELISRSPCPVLGVNQRSVETEIFRPGRPAPDHPARILVPVGSGEDDLGAVAHAVELSRRFGMHLTFLGVAPAGQASTGSEASIRRAARRQRELEARIGRLLPQGTAEFACLSIPGRPCREIVRMAEELKSDLIVMEGHHPGIFRHLLAPPTSCSVLHDSACPVWFVPPGVQAGDGRKAREMVAG